MPIEKGQKSKVKQKLVKGDKLVTGKELVEVTYTGKAKYNKEGSKSLVHPAVADKLAETGRAQITKNSETTLDAVRDAKTEPVE